MSCILYIMSNKQDTSENAIRPGVSNPNDGPCESAAPMSFEEKSVWVQLAATSIALVAYLFIAGKMLASGERAMPAFAALFIGATIFLVCLLIAGYVLAALSGRHDAADERDRLIAWRAEHSSSWLLAAGVFASIVCLMAGIENALTVNVLIAALFVAEVIGFALRIVYYRKGM